jgi:hypothetical protein
MRAARHLSILILLGIVTVGGVGARWDPEATPPSVLAQAAPGLAGGLVAQPSVAVAVAAAAAAPAEQQPPLVSPAAPSVVPTPARRWVQNFRPTPLFAGPEPSAATLGQAAQFGTYEVVEAPESGRAKLFDPGRGVGRLPGYVWANLQDFGPSGAPQPHYELAGAAPTSDPSTQRQVPTRVGEGWPRMPTAEMAVVLDGESGGVLYGKNARTRVAPASLTKIMTAIIGIEHAKPQDRVRVDVDARTMWESTVMGLTPGEVVSLETLLYGLMLPSGNDAALAIGRHVAGSDARFVELMNEKARTLGLVDTQFRNPHGLDADGHYSSPYDLAMMSRHGMQDPLFHSLSATQHWQSEGYNLWNLNKLLGQYPGADGVKVGFTDNAGRCIVASATRNGRRVFVALIRSHDPVGESRMLLDYAFQNFRW